MNQETHGVAGGHNQTGEARIQETGFRIQKPEARMAAAPGCERTPTI
jgi:hypothetical protein